MLLRINGYVTKALFICFYYSNFADKDSSAFFYRICASCWDWDWGWGWVLGICFVYLGCGYYYYSGFRLTLTDWNKLGSDSEFDTTELNLS